VCVPVWRREVFFFFFEGSKFKGGQNRDAGGREWEQSKTHSFEQPERQRTRMHAGAKRGYGCHMHIHIPNYTVAERTLAAGSEEGSGTRRA
jgi:hypothetical protein